MRQDWRTLSFDRDKLTEGDPFCFFRGIRGRRAVVIAGVSAAESLFLLCKARAVFDVRIWSGRARRVEQWQIFLEVEAETGRLLRHVLLIARVNFQEEASRASLKRVDLFELRQTLG